MLAHHRRTRATHTTSDKATSAPLANPPRGRQRTTHTFAAAATALALLTGTAACSSPPEPQPLGVEEPTGTVQFWGRNALTEWDQAVVKAFNDSHEDLKVEYTPINDENYVTRLSTALRSGDVPDLVSIDDVSSLQYINAGQFLDITDEVNGLDFRDQLNPAQLDLATLEGRIYGTPAVSDLSVLLYNKALFDQAGITAAPTNFPELLDAARAVRALGDETYGITFAGQCGGCLTFTALPNVYAAGSDVLDGDINNQSGNIEGNEPLRQTLEMYRTIWTEGLAPQQAQSEDGTLWTQDFQAGTIGMAPSGLFSYASAPEEVRANLAVAPLPGPEGGISTYIGGANFAIPADSVNQAGAFEYIKFALDLAQQRTAAEVGYSPVRIDLAADPTFTQDFPTIAPGLQAAATGKAPRTLHHNEIFTQASGPWLTMFNRAVFDGDIDGALQEGQAGFDTVLGG